MAEAQLQPCTEYNSPSLVAAQLTPQLQSETVKTLSLPGDSIISQTHTEAQK